MNQKKTELKFSRLKEIKMILKKNVKIVKIHKSNTLKYK